MVKHRNRQRLKTLAMCKLLGARIAGGTMKKYLFAIIAICQERKRFSAQMGKERKETNEEDCFSCIDNNSVADVMRL